MKAVDHKLQKAAMLKLESARSNAIARSHSGMRVKHVQEWYSGDKYRVDVNYEGLLSPEYLKNHPDSYPSPDFVYINKSLLTGYVACKQKREAEFSGVA